MKHQGASAKAFGKSRLVARFVRGSAAAFALGIFFSGPQAAVAGADAGSDSASSSTGMGPTDPAPRKSAAVRGSDRMSAGGEDAGRGVRARQAAAARQVQPAAAVAERDTAAVESRRAAIADETRPAPSAPGPEVNLPARDDVQAGAGGPGAAGGSAVAAVTALVATASAGYDGGGARVEIAPIEAAATPAPPGPAEPAEVPTIAAAGAAVFDTLAELVALLPNQGLADLLAGALLLVRRNLFDQAPTASPVQEMTTSDGRILGTVGGIDLEEDPLTYRLQTPAQFGSVELGIDGHYTYTPGQQFAGSDSFVVTVAETNGGFNLLDPFGDRFTEVTVVVGSQAATDPFRPENRNDATLLLNDTPARVTVTNSSGGLLGSVTLAVADDTTLRWLDEEGRTGTISMADMAQRWDGIENAGKVTLGLSYTLTDGRDAVVILQSVRATSNGPGQYTFNGALAPNVDDGAGVTSFWDVIGSGYEGPYEAFLTGNGIASSGFQSMSQDVARADLYLDTYSVHDYKTALKGTDPGMPVAGPDPTPAGAAARAALIGSRAAVSAGPAVTTVLPYGSSLIVGQRDGSVEQWTGESFTQLQAPGASPVKTLVPYRAGFAVALENGAVRYWDGAQWTELLSYAMLTAQSGGTWRPQDKNLTTMVAYGTGLVIGTRQGEVKQWTGTGWNDLAPDKFGTGQIGTMVGYKTGLVVGVSDGVDQGAVRYWDGTGWQELQRPNGTAVTALTPYWDGQLAVGRNDGAVDMWTGTQWTSLSGAGSPVTAMLVDPLGKLVVGRADGSIQRRDAEDSCTTNCTQVLQRVLGNGNSLTAGEKLGLGQSLTSSNGAYALTLQQDGNLVLSGTTPGASPVWAAGSNGKNVDRAELQSDGNFVLYSGADAVWASGTAGSNDVRLVLQDDRNVVLYAGSERVWQTATQSYAAAPAGRAVTSMLGYGEQFVVGFANGSVKQGRIDYGTGQPRFQWIDLASNASGAVTAMAPYSVPPSSEGADGFYIGLDNGVIKRYGKWRNAWVDMRALPAPGAFNQDTLRQAVRFAQEQGVALSDSDPLFTLDGFQPRCQATNSCDGSVYDINMSKAVSSLASRTFAFAGPNQSVDFSYDLGTAAYGYLYVPGGVWKKLDPEQYSFGALLAVTTGPSVNLNLGDGCADNTCTVTLAETSLLSRSWSSVTPYGVITLTGDVSAKMDAVLGVPDGFTKKTLTASAYLTGGLVLSYNTPTAFWNSAWNYYLDTDVEDFTRLTSVSVIPTLTPTLTGSWGLTVPAGVPIAGGWSLMSVELAYSNPVDVSLTVAKGAPASLTVGASGALDFSAGLVPNLTSSLTYTTTFPLYDVRTGNLLSSL